jgi:catechol 2,3-dioxygenase-like lactoylglutathione lyase family enzyme
MSDRPPLANVVTLGVTDLAREREFYQRPDWPAVLDTDDFVAFELRGLVLALSGADDLGRDASAARVTKEPTAAEFFDGRDAYFADPEGNFWEVAWSGTDNPVTAAARRAAGL